ncbi:hypothetical protein ACN42_g8476 [Penicillium freii]|uniref:Uncharacterized protein n=1 Tax=Penicillium freii TaxID=48697 RepID=A0A101MDZ0_PENFR|nr:hypothetical protein ACN42_g8476 [Penicillium freii]
MAKVTQKCAINEEYMINFKPFHPKKNIKHLRNIDGVLASQAQSPCGDSRDPVTPASLQTTSVISRRPHRPGDNRSVCSSLLRQSYPTGFSSTPPSLDLFLLFRSRLLLTLPPNLRP